MEHPTAENQWIIKNILDSFICIDKRNRPQEYTLEYTVASKIFGGERMYSTEAEYILNKQGE